MKKISVRKKLPRRAGERLFGVIFTWFCRMRRRKTHAAGDDKRRAAAVHPATVEVDGRIVPERKILPGPGAGRMAPDRI
ncbi:MAG: hypothetical protein LIQ30_05850 [Planctomycetes bacterium]|nr:hypothetical protein [Planctomycetota bacterium]MCD7897517.1 hypothetical protein [Planctomycetaceae bacterium]